LTGIETTVLAVGKSVAVMAGRVWLADSASSKIRSADLTDLIKVKFSDRIVRRRIERQIEDIADSVSERLLALCRQEFKDLTDNDRASAVEEVKITLASSDLSDRALFKSDADAIKLSANLRARLPRPRAEFELGEAGAQLYQALLDECCDCLVRIVLQLPQFGPRATQDILSRLSALGIGVAAALARLPARTLDAPQGTQDDNEFRRRYLEQVSSSLDYSELFGINFERYRPRITLSVSYISLSVSPDGPSREERTATYVRGQYVAGDEPPGRDSYALRVEAALGKARRMMIRGEAGSGKTTLLRWLAVTAARGSFTSELEEWNGCVPFLVKLRSYADSGLPPPEEFLTGVADAIKGLMPQGWVHRQLSSGRALILIDGVDELASSQRRAVRSWLSDLLIAYSDIQVVLTSRPAAASADWLAAEGFDSAFLERMSPADIRSLIHHWHLAARDAGGLPCEIDELASYEAGLLARLEGAPHLRALAGTPLLAAMLCSLNLDRVRQLPRDRMSLYAAALDMLINRRDIERGIPSHQEIALEGSQKIQLLQGLAWRLSTTSRSELPKGTVLQCVSHSIETMPRSGNLDAEEVVNYLLQRSGVLREPMQGRIDFIHRTIQEYLTAKQLADEGDMDLLIRYAHRDQWRDILIMAAGHANAPLRHELLSGLLGRIDQEKKHARQLKLVTASCLETLNSLPEDLAPDIYGCLDDLIPPRDQVAARSLATVGEPVLDRLPTSLTDVSNAAARATVRTAWLINGPVALSVLANYRQDPRLDIQGELLNGWPYFDVVEYAKSVLADAPLLGGNAFVESTSCLPAVKYLARLTSLDAMLPEVTDLSVLGDISCLQWLAIEKLKSERLDPLTRHSPSLKHLRIADVRFVRDYAPLAKLTNLKTLDLGQGPINDLKFLSDMPQITELRLGFLTLVTNYSPLRALGSLTNLYLNQCKGLRKLKDLPLTDQILTLSLSRSALSCDLSDMIAQVPNVRQLTLDFAEWVSGLESLRDNTNLQRLRLWGCKNVTDVEPIATCSKLTSLDLDRTSVSDITPIENLHDLRTLWLKECPGVNDLTALRPLSSLSNLYIQGIADDTDLSPLADNPRVTIYIYSHQKVRGDEPFGRRLVRVAN
jgi:hypothetical protein